MKYRLSDIKKIARDKSWTPNLRAYICGGKFTRALAKDYYNNRIMSGFTSPHFRSAANIWRFSGIAFGGRR